MFPAAEQVCVGDAERLRSRVWALSPWLLTAFAGLFALASALLWRVWTTDPLRSIGIYFPFVSAILLSRAWKQLGWETRGTWWGLLPLLYAVITSFSGRYNTPEIYVIAMRQWVHLLPVGLTVFAYASGVVLLLGGARVWRKALFPLCLLLFVNPVPGGFTRIDLPLQYFCARAAREFALAIGVSPNGDQLRLLFAPDFGMFIAPGCNGMRGAVTMGYLALILGYLYRFSLLTRIVFVSGSLALGYAFNLIRLFVLVVFYRVALRFPVLQSHAEGADYLLGGGLFLCAAVLFVLVVQWKKQPVDEQKLAPIRDVDCGSGSNRKDGLLLWKGIGVSVLTVLSVFPFLRGALDAVRGTTNSSESVLLAAGILPQQMGKYRLLRTWEERDLDDHLIYRWGAYAAGDPADEIAIGFSLTPGPHYPIGCHIARGDKPVWQSVQRLSTANGGSATFGLFLYKDEEDQTLEATTVCDEVGCKEPALLSSLGVLASMSTRDFRSFGPLSVLIQKRSKNPVLTSANLRTQMLHDLQEFVSEVNVRALVGVAETRN
jgi:exosortase J